MADDQSPPEALDEHSRPVPSVSVFLSPSKTRLVLAGEVDGSMHSEMAAGIKAVEARALPVEVDTRHVTFMDSAALALIAGLAHRHPGPPLQFIAPPDLVRFLLDVTQLGAAVEILETDPGFPDGSFPPEPSAPVA